MNGTELKPDRRYLPSGSTVLCAVSGGSDSVCLLHLLKNQSDLQVLCAHYNHCLRGEESDGDEAFVKALCEKWSIPFFSGRGDVSAYAEKNGLSAESAARELRYSFLQGTAAAVGADLIATAHTASDNAETQLLNLCRGTGTRGLAGIPPLRDNIVRPILHLTRADVERYLAEFGLPHREDSTNALDDASRNRIRHSVTPVLKSINPAAEQNMLRTAALVREDEQLLTALAEKAMQNMTDKGALVPSLLLREAMPLQYRILRAFCGGNLSLQHFEAVQALCASSDPHASLDLPGLLVRREYDRLLKGEPGNVETADVVLEPPCSGVWAGGRLAFSAEICPQNGVVQNSLNTFNIACGKIRGKLMLTSRREGDALVLKGRPGRRTLRRLMIDAKLPLSQRALVPVLRDDGGVLAVLGFGQAENTLPQPGESFYRITFKELLP